MSALFDRIARLGLDSPRGVVVAALCIAALCGVLAAGLRVDSSRHSMVSDSDPHQRLQNDYFERFGYPDTMVVVISADDAEARRAFAGRLERALNEDPLFEGRVLAGVDQARFAELALLVDANRTAPSGTDELGFFVTEDGRHSLVLAFPQIPGTQQAHEVEPWVDRIRQVRDSIIVDYPGLSADVTGAAPLVVDEQREISRAVTLTSGVTGAAILLALLFGFRSIRAALIAIVPVALGVVATLAFARLAFGELNMVTSSASSILLGLGIDFGVYLVRRFGELRAHGAGRDEAIRETVHRAGAALAVGAITTVGAFLTITTTRFTAYSRLGVIIAIGLGLTLLATLVVLPAILRLAIPKDAEPIRMRSLSWLTPVIVGGAKPIVGLAAVLLAAASVAAATVPFNTRFYDFIPGHVESARALHIIENDVTATPLRATIPVADIEQSRALAERLRALDVVRAVQGPADILPPLDLDALRTRVEATRRLEAAYFVRARAGAEPVLERGYYLPSDLPEPLRSQWVSRDQSEVALHVIPAGDIWNPDTARRFHEEVSALAPRATGLPMSIHVHLAYIREGFLRAAALSALVVLLVVAVSFGRWRDALWTLAPCLAAFVWMLGAMKLLAIPLDAANIVALPLILGITIDASVHIMHRVREGEAERGFATFGDVLAGTGSASVLASVTTMFGFAALMLADYGAMKSLGITMTLGIASGIVSAVIVLPAALRLAGRLRV